MYSARYTEFMYWCTLGLMIASCKLIKRLTGEREGARGGGGGQKAGAYSGSSNSKLVNHPKECYFGRDALRPNRVVLYVTSQYPGNI